LIISQGLPKILWFLRKLFAARVTGKVVITDENLGVFEIFEGDFDHVKLLDVKGARIQEIPQGLTLCTSLTDLELNENYISCISDEFCECWSLRKASFSNNRISNHMNMNIANLQLLADVDVSGNFLSVVPEAIFKIPNIQIINISNNRIPGFKVPVNAWQSLTQLDISKNLFSELPVSLFDVVGIKVLLVAHNSLSYMQQHFNAFQKLTNLDISSNAVENIEGLQQLVFLKSLNASKNKINTVSHHFGGFSDLQELKLDGNTLDFPPLEVISTGSQNTLALMRQFYEGYNSGSLDIQAFGLRSLSVQLLKMDHLLVLNARNNSIFIIPPEISFLTNLQELYLDNNRIGCIPTQVRFSRDFWADPI
jgi:Leucine-rich repeat (LRR) protein